MKRMDQGKKETAEGEGDEEDWALDCVVVGSSGKTFQASKAVLAAKSKVFKEILSKPPSAGQAPGDPVTLQLDDDDQEIQALLENFHHPDKFLKSIIPELSKEGVQSLKSLTVIATKYGLKGVLRQVEACLSTTQVLESFASSYGSGDLIESWLFACRFGLRDVLLEIEDMVQSDPHKLKGSVTAISSKIRELSSDAQASAIASILRMFQRSVEARNKMATKCESVLSAVKKHRSEQPACPAFPRYVEEYLESNVRVLKKRKHER